MDCAFGTFISAMVIFVCLLIMSLMDFVNNMHIIENNNPAPNNIPGNVIEEENIQNVVEDDDLPLVEDEQNQQLGGEIDGQNELQNQDQNLEPNQDQNGHEIIPNEEAFREDEFGGEYDEDGDAEMIDAQEENDINEEDIDDVHNDDPDALIAHYNEVMALFNQIPHHADLPLPPPANGVDNNGAQGAGEAEPLMEEEENLFGNMFFGILDGNAGEVDFNELGTPLFYYYYFFKFFIIFKYWVGYFVVLTQCFSGISWVANWAGIEGDCTHTFQCLLFSPLCFDSPCVGQIFITGFALSSLLLLSLFP